MYFIVGLGVLFFIMLGGLVYLYKRIRKYKFIREHKVLGRIIAAFAPLICALAITFLLGMSKFNVMVILLHLIVIWMLCDLAGLIINKCKKPKKKKKKNQKRYFAGTAAIAITVVYLCAAWFFGHHVFETTYDITTEKYVGENLRIAQITDLHLGTTLSGEDFAAELKRVQAQKPDILVLTGDIVDDDTKKADLEVACDALGKFEATHGIYFVYGNHDKGYYDSRDFDAAEFAEMLEASGVRILEDEAMFINSSFYIIGRRDKSDPQRKELSEITSDLDSSKYMIVLNHQPDDYANEEAAGVDLVLSGHTHGGHIFPAGVVGQIIGTDDKCYGREVRGITNFIVSSGISGWAIPFKSFAICEYVIIDVKQA